MVKTLGWTPDQRKVQSRLARKGLFVRLRRGLYLVPSRLPLGGRWSPGEFLALSALIAVGGKLPKSLAPTPFTATVGRSKYQDRIYVS